MAVLSKYESLNAQFTCRDLMHPDTSSCFAYIPAEVALPTLKAGLALYIPFYLVVQIVKYKGKVKLGKLVYDVTRSLAYLLMSSCGTVLMVCFCRKVLGKYFFYCPVALSGTLSSAIAISLDQKPRRGQLAVYTLSMTLEGWFYVALKKGYVKRRKNGEVYFFMVSMAVLMYFYRKEQSRLGFSGTVFRFLLGETKETISPSTNMSVKPSSMNLLLQLKTWSSYALRCALVNLGISSTLTLIRGASKLIKKPTTILKLLLSKSNANFWAFLSSFVVLFKIGEAFAEYLRGGKYASNAILAGALSGLSMIFQKSSATSAYSLAKSLELIYREAARYGMLPTFQYGDILLYTVANVPLLHLAVFEQDSLSPKYLKLLDSVTGNRIRNLSRRANEVFGVDA